MARSAPGGRSSRPATTRRTSGRKPTAPAAQREAARAPYTGRAVVLGAALCAVLVTLAVPVREFVSQRQAISKAAAEQAATRRQVAELEAEKERFKDPAYVKRLARERLHFVMPGEANYIVLGADQAKPATTKLGRSTVSKSDRLPWYSRLWKSDVSAGRAK